MSHLVYSHVWNFTSPPATFNTKLFWKLFTTFKFNLIWWHHCMYVTWILWTCVFISLWISSYIRWLMFLGSATFLVHLSFLVCSFLPCSFHENTFTLHIFIFTCTTLSICIGSSFLSIFLHVLHFFISCNYLVFLFPQHKILSRVLFLVRFNHFHI